MKSKILIFILSIFTFGLFLIPYSFAKDYGTNNLNLINRINRIEDIQNNSFDLYYDYSDLTGNGKYYYGSISFYDSNYNNYLPTLSRCYLYYKTSSTSSWTAVSLTLKNINGAYCYYFDDSNLSVTNYVYDLQIEITFTNSSDYNNFKTNNYVNMLLYRSTSANGAYPFVNSFIGNTFYSSFKNVGVFNNTQVNLLLQGQQGNGRDITSDVLSFNTISFSEPLLTQIANNNNVSGYQYYIRVYFRDYLKNLTNFKLSYLEVYDMRFNGVTYNSLNSARQQLPILSNNIALYNDDAALFTTDNIINSGYEDYYLEYITFNIVNYTFKSSTYYNANIGIKGYLKSTYISAIGANAINTYNEGVSNGFSQGEKVGYDKGFNDALASNRTGFDSLMFAIADVPIGIISSMLNFEILGVNLLGFFMGIITLTLFIFLFRKFKE